MGSFASWDAAVAAGGAQYRDVLDLLADSGLPAEFIDTGGGYAVLEVELLGGRALWIGDGAAEGLSWRRTDHKGWTVGLRPAPEEDDGVELALIEATDGSADALMPLVDRILRDTATSSNSVIQGRLDAAKDARTRPSAS
jgi:hypothetical protein